MLCTVEHRSTGCQPARGRLSREKQYFSVPARARKFGLAKLVRPSCPASAWLFSTLKLNLVLTIHAIGPVPSLSGHVITYRWRSLPRVRRNRASKPQGSSERVLPLQVPLDRLMCTSLFPAVVSCTSFDMPHVNEHSSQPCFTNTRPLRYQK